ncbi:MAG: hypothetical protein HN764_12525 [Gammaproteobacteria bacterium]|jgi:hypothetical protein|nr:hypothetical protein [Gammaproteobacteria bacterium]
MIKQNQIYALLIFICVTTVGCNSTSVRSTEREKIAPQTVQVTEDLLLDVGIGIFEPGVDAISSGEPGVYPKIREAEARFMPYMLMDTMQNSGSWGTVRVIPQRQSEMDIWVDAEILRSDGENLELLVKVQDSSGKNWYTKKYTDVASKYSYDTSLPNRTEPFQAMYNQISNDILTYYRQLDANQIKTIRVITELKFAREFSTDAFGDHLGIDKKGRYFITRLPADDDPILLRVRQIRERDYMFVDTLQEYYASFVRQMEQPYLEWRRAYYEENKALQEVKKQSRNRIIGGALAVLAGVLAQGVDSRTARTAGVVGIGAGVGAVMSGLNKKEEAKVHAEALEEISASMDAEMEPHNMKLENRTVTLSGSVNEQYGQWRQILKDIYTAETGEATSVQ